MAKIVVAFRDKQVTRQISETLEAAGYEVFRTCSTGNEVMRAFGICQDGLLICGARFQDRTADALAWDLGKRAVILVIGRADQAEACEHPDIYFLKTPFYKHELTATVNVMLQMHYKRLPHRSVSERDLIDRAKEILMRRCGMTEKEAHQFLQKESMRRGVKMLDSAQKILESETGE
jgi:AmiR/NasT family two-component response regulator